MENAMTEQNPPPPAPPSPQPPAGTPAEPAPAATGEKPPPWGKPENFNADQAWDLIQKLRGEKNGGDPTLKSELEQMRADQQKQRDALALALGVKPEETSDSDKLAQRVEALHGQVLASEKRALAVEFKVPETMLTAGDAEGLRKQASDLAEFALAAHYAASTAATAPPAFQQNPGQGQTGNPMTPEAQAAAEYEKYYPSPTR